MDPEFWHQKWEANQIGFHLEHTNPLLVENINQLDLEKSSRVLVPLCGKTLDIAWLLSQGYTVAGCELSQMAVQQLFTKLEITPAIEQVDSFLRYSTDGLDIYVGDIFNISTDIIGPIDAVYDRAALIALPEATRANYTKHLMGLCALAPQLLVSIEYNQSIMKGPPFSVDALEITRHYSNYYQLQLLSDLDMPGGLKGQYPAQEKAWLLKAK